MWESGVKLEEWGAIPWRSTIWFLGLWLIVRSWEPPSAHDWGCHQRSKKHKAGTRTKHSVLSSNSFSFAGLGPVCVWRLGSTYKCLWKVIEELFSNCPGVPKDQGSCCRGEEAQPNRKLQALCLNSKQTALLLMVLCIGIVFMILSPGRFNFFEKISYSKDLLFYNISRSKITSTNTWQTMRSGRSSESAGFREQLWFMAQDVPKMYKIPSSRPCPRWAVSSAKEAFGPMVPCTQ